MYVHICIYVHIFMFINKYTYIYIYTSIYKYIYIHIDIHIMRSQSSYAFSTGASPKILQDWLPSGFPKPHDFVPSPAEWFGEFQWSPCHPSDESSSFLQTLEIEIPWYFKWYRIIYDITRSIWPKVMDFWKQAIDFSHESCFIGHWRQSSKWIHAFPRPNWAAKKKNSYFPLYWLFNWDSYNGFL